VRRAACLLAALVLAGSDGRTRLFAGEEPLAPLDAKDWEARDFEGRWALFRAANPGHTNLETSPWGRFLVEHREWQVLTWIALTTDDLFPLHALHEAKHPNWVAVAVWNMNARDSHVSLDGPAILKEQPALMRSWFALHPEAVVGAVAPFAKDLAAQGTTRDDAGAAALAPPVSSAALLADLSPPPTVLAFGDRRRAEPDVRYVHQVERALDLLSRAGPRGPTWTARLAALLAHPVAALRLAAARACGSHHGDEVPLAALLARIDAPDESPAVRSAAVLALPAYELLAAHGKLLHVGSDPRHPAFTAAVSRLADLDEGFALELWKGLDLGPDGPSAFLAGARGQIAARLEARRGREVDLRIVPRMLALVVHLRRQRDPLAARLTSWTLDTLVARKADGYVAASVEYTAREFDPADLAPHYAGDTRLRDEVRALARDVLARRVAAPASR
jgi:hypothetical protein